MKTAWMLVLLLVVTASSVAASEIGDIVKDIAINYAGQAAADALNRRESVKPVHVGELGIIRIEGESRGGWYGVDMATALMQHACQNVGFSGAAVEDREIVREEAELGGSPVLFPAELVGRFTLREGDGRWTDALVRGRASHYGIETDSVWAHMVFTVSLNGVIIASSEVEASDRAISIDASGGWWSGFQFRSREPNRRDLAVSAACQKAANEVAAKLVQRVAWRYDPLTGRPLAREGICFACECVLPAGALFCPRCGQDLRRPVVLVPGEFQPVLP